MHRTILVAAHVRRLALACAFTLAVATSASAATGVYEFTWQSLSRLSVLDQGVFGGVLSGTGTATLDSSGTGTLSLGFTSPAGGGAGQIAGATVADGLTFPIAGFPAGVALPAAPGSGPYTFVGDHDQPTSFSVNFRQGFLCQRPAECSAAGSVLQWTAEFSGQGTLRTVTPAAEPSTLVAVAAMLLAAVRLRRR
jgi:hypothetical protein